MEGFNFNLKPLQILILLVLFDSAIAKECTNIPTQLSSHSFRFDLLSSDNDSRKHETFSHYHNQLTPTDDSAWSALLPTNLLNNQEHELQWTAMYQKIKNQGGSGSVPNFLKEFSLHDVRLLLDPSSIHWRAQETNLEYLLMLDVDSLVWSFRKTAGLVNPPGRPYGGWEDPKVELRGHFVGHYLSASAKMWASTYNRTLQEKMSQVVSALMLCQEKIGSGYLSAFPSELFDRFEAIKPVWAPYYTIHKILAGLLDQYTVAGDARALKMVTWMVEYFYKRVQNVIVKYTIERHWTSLNEETGGMNDVLYKLYSITNDPKHLVLAHLFDKPCFLGLLALQADDISGFHANTHIPIVIGSQMRYEITKDPLYKTIAAYFIDIVNSSHSYATGGTSVSEFWSDPKRLASTLSTENEESCTTYNMLKVSRHLFTWTKEMAYADYYERALTNGVLSIQRGTEPGVMIYMLPLIPGGSKAKSHHGWGTKFDSFWCCYGTGIESFSKLGDSIYFEEQYKVPSLYIIQYISSSVNWRAGNVAIEQRVDPIESSDPHLRATFTFSPKQGNQLSTLNLRIPIWTYSIGAKAELNTQSLTLLAPGSFLSVTRRWSSSDKLTLQLPMALRTEPIKDDRSGYASFQAILFGPYLLAGLTHGDSEIKSGTALSLPDLILPVPFANNSQLVSLFQQSEEGTGYVLTNSNQSIRMEKYPEIGTDSALHATFRFISKDPISSISTKDIIGKSIMLEPMAFPGMFVTQRGTDSNLLVEESISEGSNVFRLVPGLDGRSETVSLESDGHRGCFVSSYDEGGRTKIACDLGSPEIKRSSSFVMRKGIGSYDPISFVLRGQKRNFLLAPLLSLRDESYTVYFNFKA